MYVCMYVILNTYGMRGEREEGADLVGPDEPLGHGAAAPLAFLRERRGALLQARHHVRRHADGRRAAARRRRLRLQHTHTHTHVNTCDAQIFSKTFTDPKLYGF